MIDGKQQKNQIGSRVIHINSFQFIPRLSTHADSVLTFMKPFTELTCVDSHMTGFGQNFLTKFQESIPRINKSLRYFSKPFFFRISSHLMPGDQLGVDMWRNTHFVYECTVKTATADVSPYEKHALSQNSLSSSQSHALLMIRRERKTLKQSFPVWRLAAPVCVYICVCEWVHMCHTVQKLTGGFDFNRLLDLEMSTEPIRQQIMAVQQLLVHWLVCSPLAMTTICDWLPFDAPLPKSVICRILCITSFHMMP